MSDEEDQLLAVTAALIVECGTARRRKLKRRFWTRPSLKKHAYRGSDLMKELILDDSHNINLEYRCDVGFKNFFRMTTSDFENLLSMVGPKIAKTDTKFRKAIPASERLAVSLRFFATGDSYQSLMYTFKISKQVISRTIPEVCDALIESLQDYIKMPANEREWEIISEEFEDKWNFPHCVGAMDGKHITLQAPLNSGSDYFNYKSFFSIVLLAVVDANYNFIYANVGSQGRISDGGVFNATQFKKWLGESTLNLPSVRVLPGRNVAVPFVFVADDAFPLSYNIMKPFPGLQEKGSKSRIFNYRLSRARRVSENAFGIISSVFRILRKPMLLQPETASKITLTLLHLHNYLRKSKSKNVYNPRECFDSESAETGDITPGLWRQDVTRFQMMNIPKVPRRSTTAAQSVRNEFAEYFNSPEGDLPFQHNHN